MVNCIINVSSSYVPLVEFKHFILFLNGKNKKKVHIHTIYLFFKTGGLQAKDP